MSVSEAAASGNRVAALISLRDLLAEYLDRRPGARDAAALAKQLADVVRELDALRIPEELDDVDEVARRRAARRAASGLQ